MENTHNERVKKAISVLFINSISFIILLFLTFNLSFSQNEALSPEDVVREFYDALSQKDCKRAIELRPSYSEKSCTIVDNVHVYTVDLVEQNHKYAKVYLVVSFSKGNGLEKFAGNVELIYQNNSWIINNVIKELPELSVEQKSQELSTGSITAPLEPEDTKSPKDNILTDTEKPEVEKPKEKQYDVVVKSLSDIATIVDGLTFGSLTILEKCWNENELKGSPNDKEIAKLTKLDKTPPQRKLPIFKERPLFRELQNSIRRVTPRNNKKVIALTFDLCELSNEVTGYDAEIVNYLREHRIKATFFAGGKWLRSHSEKAMQLMADPLFEIGNHTWTHSNLHVLESQQIEEQILWTQAQYELLREELRQKNCVQQLDASEMAKIPLTPMSFRFPYGTCNSKSLQLLAKYGLPAIQWDVVTADPSPNQTAKNITQIILTKAKPGSIIICHANGRGYGTADALPMFVPKLRKMGYTFVTVSELLYQGEVVSVPKCYEQQPGDNTHYDKKFGKGM